MAQEYSTLQKCSAEVFGTFLFLFVIQMTGGTIKGNVESGLFVAILLLGGISGGHFNPAVTIAFIIQQGVTVVEGILYIISQLIGGTMAALLKYMLTNQTLPWGPTTYPGSITLGQVYLAETVATMGFIFVILTQTNPKTQISKNPTVIAFLIPLGLYIFRETVEFTGAYLNPCIALTFGGVANMIAPGQKMDNLYVYLLSGISAGIFTPLIFQAFQSLQLIQRKNLYLEQEDREPLLSTQQP